MLIKNAKVLIGKSFVDADIQFDKTITAVGTLEGEADLDARGCYVVPGLVDIHTHGAVGEDFSDGRPEGLQPLADYYAAHGVTSYLATTMTMKEADLIPAMHAVRDFRRKGGAKCAGVHLEGPFLSTAKKGAQNGDFLHDPDSAMLRRLQKAAEGCVKLVTVAPEQPGAMDFIRAAVADGIAVSVGHTTADYDTAAAAFAAGADHATHLYNGMPPLHHRSPSVIGAAFDDPKVQVELICDGIHIHSSVVRATFRLFGAERVILISDSLRATGMPDGQYPFGGQEIEVHGNRATILGHPETLAGSVTSLMGCLRQAVAFGVPLADAVRAASYNPARSIGIDRQAGSLDTGKEASLILLDREDLSIRAIVFQGELLEQ